MKNNLIPKIAAILAGLLVCSNSWAALIPTAPTLTVGGRAMTDLTNLIILEAAVSGSTTSSISTFRIPGGASGYTPSGIKKFVAVALHAEVSAAAGNSALIGSADNDSGILGNTAPTNPIYNMAGGSAIIGMFDTATTGSKEQPFALIIPNGKFGFLKSVGASYVGTVRILGYEQ